MLTHSWHYFAQACAIVDTIMDTENLNADTLLILFFLPICVIVEWIWKIPMLTHSLHYFAPT